MNKRLSWHPIHRYCLPVHLRSWLMDRASLTQRLIKHSAEPFAVDLLRNDWRRPLLTEARCLLIKHSELTYQREVRLLAGQVAMVYARTIIPRSTYLAMPYRFSSLGTQSLGQLLFSHPSVKRGPIEVACIKPHHEMYAAAVSNEIEHPETLWARRSIFELSGKKILVNEIFLPSLLGSM